MTGGALVALPRLQHARGNGLARGERVLPEEAAIAFHYNGRSHAVMMATPADLDDFAVGFSLNEGLITRASDITSLDVQRTGDAIELRMQVVTAPPASTTGTRLTGVSGCGLCGVTCTKDALRAVHLHAREAAAAPAPISFKSIAGAMQALQAAQPLNQSARALHAAGFWQPGDGLIAVREDIGRHSALDKLTGALARGTVPAANGAVLLTSRVSVELVQKTARLGARLLLAVSAPTALAVRTADAAGITLIAVVRGEDFEVFTHPSRVAGAHSLAMADAIK